MKPAHILIAILVAASWGFNFVVIKVGIDSFSPLLFSALRFTLAAIPLVFFMPRPKVSWRIIVAIGMVLGVIKFSLLFIGMDVGLSAGLASLVLQVQAFFTVILAALILGERPRPMQIAGMIVAFCGVALVSTTVDASVTYLGLSLVLLAALAWAFSNLLMKQAGQVNMVHLMVWVSLVPPIPLLVLSLIFEGPESALIAFNQMDWKGVGAVVYIALIVTVVGFAIWGWLIAQYGAGSVAPFSLLVPIFGMGFSALFLGEQFGMIRLIAAALVILGLVLTVVKLPKKMQTPVKSQA